jgi:L-2-hydroxyglutarate oxidase LhgO
LGACKISEIAGIDVEEAGYKYSYCKGTYFRVMRNLDKFPKMLIYPSPPGPGTVGIHTTPDLAGGMRLGPDDKWVDKIDYSVDDTQKEYFFESARRFLPYLKIEDLQADSSGIHPKIQKHGEGIRDFIIRHEEDRGLYGFINLVGIESPGLTSSPAIGKYVAEMLKEIIL